MAYTLIILATSKNGGFVRDLIYFAHGNGFPARCYRQLLNVLNENYDYCFLDKIGHNPRFPVTENWHFLVLEIIDDIEKKSNRPVIAVGHSLGGLLIFLAAIERPDLFKAVVMLDSPLFGPFKSRLVRLAKILGFIDRLTPASRTRRRREYWLEDKEQLSSYLRRKKLFRNFTDQCLQDYIDYGLETTGIGYVLRFDRHIEYLIYRTLHHKLSEHEGKLLTPSALIYGNKSPVVDSSDLYYMKNYYKILCCKTMGSHMYPMEYPVETAEKICWCLNALLN